MTQFPLRSIMVPEEGQRAIGALLAGARPDIEIVLGADAEPPASPYAVIAFNPGPVINRFADAAWVHVAGAGTDKIEAAMEFTPPLMTRTLGELGAQIAEYVLAYVLQRSQRMAARAQAQARAEWSKDATQPRYLNGQRAVIFGTGAIGQEIALRLTQFGVIVDGVSRSGDAVSPFRQVVRAADWRALEPETVDIVVLALPNRPGTRGLIGHEKLSAFRGAQLINIGRGEVLNERALIDALEAGAISEAALDVFATEPLPASSPLWSHPHVKVTPHVSGLTRPEDTVDAFLAALDALERGDTPPLLVNPGAGY
ncbi:NAD(P)-dependent oxidoreductase [Parvularcula marina]|uniref:NAD(P)-dependent oxidoreductase n=1 Tax=Parvularcula marina TaxID=2292771 RepID=UPI0035163615